MTSKFLGFSRCKIGLRKISHHSSNGCFTDKCGDRLESDSKKLLKKKELNENYRTESYNI